MHFKDIMLWNCDLWTAFLTSKRIVYTAFNILTVITVKKSLMEISFRILIALYAILYRGYLPKVDSYPYFFVVF